MLQWDDSEAVALACFTLVQREHRPDVTAKGEIGEFLGNLNDVPPSGNPNGSGKAGSGRRPAGLNKKPAGAGGGGKAPRQAQSH